MALTMELFTTHGRGANGSNCVCTCTLGVKMGEGGWWSQWSTQWRGKKGGGVGDERGRTVVRWVMFAKVKNHATVQSAPDLSTGTSDYIHAGTQVLLNTSSLVLLPHQAPFHYLPPHLPSLLALPRSGPGTKAYLLYKSHHMFVCRRSYLAACSVKKRNRESTLHSQNTKPPPSQDVTPLFLSFTCTVLIVRVCL